MGRTINSADLNNKLMVECDNFGILRTPILKFCEDVISECPTVRAEVRTGHWIAVDHQRLIHRCSECGTEGYVNTCNHIPTWKYCPICGIKMIEPQESEEQA